MEGMTGYYWRVLRSFKHPLAAVFTVKLVLLQHPRVEGVDFLRLGHRLPSETGAAGAVLAPPHAVAGLLLGKASSPVTH